MFIMVTMTPLIFYFAFIFVTSVLSDEVNESCIKMFSQELLEEDCCETISDSTEYTDENYDDCETDGSDDSKEAKCDEMKCFLNHMGIWKDDDINNDAAKKRLENMELKNPRNKKALQRVSKQCLDGKYLNYGTEEVCPAMKYFICEYVNSLLECDSWKKTEQCSKNSEYAAKCKASFNN